MTLQEALENSNIVRYGDRVYEVATDGKIVLRSVPKPTIVSLTKRQLMSDKWSFGLYGKSLGERFKEFFR